MSSSYSKYRRTGTSSRRGTTNSYYNRYKKIERKARGNLQAAFEQRDNADVVLNCNTLVSCLLSGASNNYRVGAINVFDALLHSEFFNNYAPMYDQVRIDKIKAKFTSLQYPQSGSLNRISNISIVTAFDRNGLDPTQIYHGQSNNVETISTSIGNAVTTYSSALTKNLSYGSPFEVTRYINPTTIAEKSQYISTDSLKQWWSNYDSVNNFWSCGVVGDQNNPYLPNAVARNPAYLERCEAVPFKPTILIGVVSIENAGLTGPCIFNVEMDVCVTFRGLRKSQTV